MSKSHRLCSKNSATMLFQSVFWFATLLTCALCASHSIADHLKRQQKRCDVSSSYAASNGIADDSPAISAAFESCADSGVVAFSDGVDYNVFKPVAATSLNDVTIEMYSNLHLPQNIIYMKETLQRGRPHRMTIIRTGSHSREPTCRARSMLGQ